MHVSGHGGKPDIKKLYEIVKPKISIPVHGDSIQIREHINFAEHLGVKENLKIRNGEFIKLEEGGAKEIQTVPVDVLAVDRNKLISIGSDLIRNRKKIAFNCSAFMTITVDNKGNLIEPIMLSTLDVADFAEYPMMIEEIENLIKLTISQTKKSRKETDEQIKEIARIAARKIINKYTDIKPVMITHLIRK